MNSRMVANLCAALACGLAMTASANWEYRAKNTDGNANNFDIVTDGNWVVKLVSKGATSFTTTTGTGQFVAGSGKLDIAQLEADTGLTWMLDGDRLDGDSAKVGWSKFGGVNAFTEVVLPARITYLEAQSFQNCKGLQKMTAPNVTTLKSSVFSGDSALCELSENFTHPNEAFTEQNEYSGCSALNVEIVTGPDFTGFAANSFASSGIGSVDMSASSVPSLVGSFTSCASLTNVVLSPVCTSIGGLNQYKAVTAMYATGACISSVAWQAFGAPAYQIRLYVDPEMDDGWAAAKIANAAVSAITDADRGSAYYTTYGLAQVEADGNLLGTWAPNGNNKIWLIKYKSKFNRAGEAQGSLVIATEPDGIGVADPPVCGTANAFTLAEDGAKRTCTASASFVDNGVSYALSGYLLEKKDGGSWVEQPAGTGNSYEYVQGSDSYRLTWLYAVSGYAVSVVPHLAGTGAVAFAPSAADGVFAADSDVTATAQPADGYKFLEWRGEVPNGCDPSSVAISFRVNKPLSLTPVFVREAGWQYLAANEEGNPYAFAIVTDGNWVVKVASKGATSFTTATGTGQFVAGAGKLDIPQLESDTGLTWMLGVDNAKVADSKFKEVSVLTEVVLPDRITYLDGRSFQNCKSLRKMTAPNVTTLRGSVFAGDSALSELSENFTHPNEAFTGQSEYNGCSSLNVGFVTGRNFTGFAWGSFSGSGIGSVDMSASSIESLGTSFTSCLNLTNIVLSPVCTKLEGQSQFASATAVYATGACLTNIAWNAFGGDAYQLRLYVDPKMDAGWGDDTIAGYAVSPITDADRVSPYYAEYGLSKVEESGSLLGTWSPYGNKKIWLIKYVSQKRKGGLTLFIK